MAPCWASNGVLYAPSKGRVRCSVAKRHLTDLGSAAAGSSCAGGGAPPARKSGMGGGAESALLCVTPMALGPRALC